jgi:hypothetical protein
VGFYKINGFIPLPYSKSIASDNFVSFPELNYLSIPRFWEQVKRIDVSTLPIKAPAKLVEQTAKLLSSANLIKPEFSKLQKEWEEHQEKILAEIFKLIPKKEYSDVLDIISTDYPKDSNKDIIKARITQLARRAISVSHVDLMCIERNLKM